MHERLASAVVKFVPLGHDFRLCLRQPHQFGIKRDHRQAVIGAISGDHGRGRSRVEFRSGLRQIAIKAGFAFGGVGSGTATERDQAQQQQSKANRIHREFHSESWPHNLIAIVAER